MTDPIRLTFVSDIHFGQASANQMEMANAFAETMFPLIPETDILCINGDLFDDLINFDNPTFDPIYRVLLQLIQLCELHQVTVRLLQGTWDHDRNQCNRVVTFYQSAKATFDFRFIESIELEKITIRGRELRFFHVPDDMPYQTSEDIVDVIRSRMHELGWDYVDYGCMHGFFDFTFPEKVAQGKAIVFKNTQFPFVRKIINVGHVHQYRVCESPEPGVYPDVISNGSFDRIVHGDQDPKGCNRIFDYPDHYTAQFVENRHSAIFDSLRFESGIDTETIRSRIIEHVSALKTDRLISLRFIVDDNEQHEAIRVFMREMYPDIRIVRKKSKDKMSGRVLLPTSPLITHHERKIAPTPKTIATFIRNTIPEDYVLSIDEIQDYLEKSG